MSSETTPIHIEDFKLALEDLTNENIESVLLQLENSLSKLRETNEYLDNEIKSNADPDSNTLYQETIAENEQVIKSQLERVAAIKQELAKRGQQSKVEEEGIYL